MKKSVIIAAGCIMTVGAILCGTFAVIAAADQGSEPPAQESSAVETVTIDPVFQASEHIKGRYNEVKDQVGKADNTIIKQIVLEEEGINLDAYYRGEVHSSKNYSETDYYSGKLDMKIDALASKYYSDMQINLVDKITVDSNTDPSIVNYNGECEFDGMAPKDMDKYCNTVNMVLNAYNDPNYELSDSDRMRLLDWFESVYDVFIQYKYFYPDMNNDRVDLTMRAVYNTVMTECGHAPLE